MARRTINQRIALEGGTEIQKQLAQLGDAGEKAFKDIQQAAEKLRGPGAQFARSMDNAIKKIRQAGEAMQQAGRKMRDLGAGMSVAVTAPVGLLGGSFIKAASDAQEAGSAFDHLFKSNAAAVRDWSSTVAKELGRGSQAIQNQAMSFQQLFSQVQPNAAAAIDLSKQFTVLSQDLASFFNVAESDALDKLRSGLSGESEPLRDFGVFMNEATVQAKALEMGLGGVPGVLTDQEKVLARTAVIMEQTAAAQGDAARTSDSFANQMKRLQGVWQDLSVTFGEIILPHALKLVQALANLAATVQSLPGPMQTLIVALAGIAAAFAPILLFLSPMVTSFGILAGWLASLGGLMAPLVTGFAGLGASAGGLAGAFAALGPILAGIGAALLSWPVLLAALGASFGALAVAVYRNWDQIEARISAAVTRIGDLFAGIGPAVQDGLARVGGAIAGAFAGLGDLASGFIGTLQGAVQAGLAGVVESIGAMFEGIPNIAKAAWDKLPGELDAAADAIRSAFSGIADFISAQFDRLQDMATRLIDSIQSKVKSLLQAIGLAKDSASGSSSSSSGGSESILRAFASGGHVSAPGATPAIRTRRGIPADGPIRGPGTGTSDSIVSKVRSGGFVIRAAAVRRYGVQLLDLLNKRRLAVGEGVQAAAAGISRMRASVPRGPSTFMARLSNGEFFVRPEAVQHYGPELFDLLNRLRLSGSTTVSGLAASVATARDSGGRLAELLKRLRMGHGGTLPGFASGGLVSLAPAAQSPVAPLSGLLGTLRIPDRVTLPAFASGGVVSSTSTFRSQTTQLREIVARVIPAFATGGPVTSNVQNFANTVRSSGSRLSQTFNSLGQMPAFATGSLVTSAPNFAAASNPGSERQLAPVNLTIGNERFEGLLAPREVADRLVRHALSDEVKSAGKRPGWFRGI